MVVPENIHTSSIIQTEQVTFRNKHEHTCMSITTTNKKVYEFEREPGIASLEGGKEGKGEMM